MNARIHTDGLHLSARTVGLIQRKLDKLEHLGGRTADPSVRAHISIKKESSSRIPAFSVKAYLEIPGKNLMASDITTPGEAPEAAVMRVTERLQHQITK